jgi:hypothetical protein
MSDPLAFTVRLEQEQDYRFQVKFDWPGVADLLVDEPAPLGSSSGPNGARLVAAAVANCLSASLFFCLHGKFKQRPGPLRAEVVGRLQRSERGRLRIGGFDVVIHLSDRAESLGHLDRCAQQFEDFCVVTQSIRQGVPVQVQVLDSEGRKLYEAGAEEGPPHTTTG